MGDRSGGGIWDVAVGPKEDFDHPFYFVCVVFCFFVLWLLMV